MGLANINALKSQSGVALIALDQVNHEHVGSGKPWTYIT